MDNNNTQTDTTSENDRKTQLRINTIIIIIAVVILVLNILLYTIVGFSAGVVGIVVTVLWIGCILLDRRMIANSYKVKAIVALAIVPAVVAFGVMELSYSQASTRLNSDLEAGYGAQKLFSEKWYDIDTSAFPDKLPEGIDDYRLFAFPSFRGEGGRFTIRFRAPDDVIAEYEAEYKAEAMYSSPMNEAKKVAFSYILNGNIEVYGDEAFWEGHEKDTVIYVLDVQGNPGDRKNMSAIIDRKDGMIELVKSGV